MYEEMGLYRQDIAYQQPHLLGKHRTQYPQCLVAQPSVALSDHGVFSSCYWVNLEPLFPTDASKGRESTSVGMLRA